MAKAILLFLSMTFAVTSFSQGKMILSHLSVLKISCGGTDTMSLFIYREKDTISAKLYRYDNDRNFISRAFTLTPGQYTYYRKSVRKIKKLKNRMVCTTAYFYTLKEKGRIIEKVDGRGKWFGLEEMLKELSTPDAGPVSTSNILPPPQNL